MEATMLWTGIALGGFLLIPVVLEFCKRNLPILFGITMILLAMYLLAPQSPEIRALWVPLSQMPHNALIHLSKLFGP